MSSNQVGLAADRGVHPPEAMMHFPLCFRFPLVPKNFLTPWKISLILPFHEKFFDFHPPKFLMTFFSHQPQISNFPLFSVFKYSFLPISIKFYIPHFSKFSRFRTFTSSPPTFTMMHLCITQCMYWTPLAAEIKKITPLAEYCISIVLCFC